MSRTGGLGQVTPVERLAGATLQFHPNLNYCQVSVLWLTSYICCWHELISKAYVLFAPTPLLKVPSIENLEVAYVQQLLLAP